MQKSVAWLLAFVSLLIVTPSFAFDEVKVAGTAEKLKLEVSNATVDNALAALRSAVDWNVSCSPPLDRRADRRVLKEISVAFFHDCSKDTGRHRDVRIGNGRGDCSKTQMFLPDQTGLCRVAGQLSWMISRAAGRRPTSDNRIQVMHPRRHRTLMTSGVEGGPRMGQPYRRGAALSESGAWVGRPLAKPAAFRGPQDAPHKYINLSI